jgi:hypothetical protein
MTSLVEVQPIELHEADDALRDPPISKVFHSKVSVQAHCFGQALWEGRRAQRAPLRRMWVLPGQHLAACLAVGPSARLCDACGTNVAAISCQAPVLRFARP